MDPARHVAHAGDGRPRLRPRLDRHLPQGRPRRGDGVLTVEPGLYFQEDDLLVPEELRGIGIRIEDDILVTADGFRNLSAALPRTSAAVEEWMGALR
ncbi:M24 family metallopeptidase [Escherichia coli]|uniref:M24 family metallopeptidase n=1 Tax=Escherichia coli TaxID=562 RepID=UPI002FC75B49